ncbi:16S rRNA (guanine(527)-N(7))-methyltransferase RsmG [uncultured Jatrophihabitans sp.]|uniref:16S rRNA (guanine(527)-N(7))-methyltransferase RsmG n=1 Tax=uncultured Jatrophihabitans sp. TaxID=1610747 RepID=UPI0035CC51A9
MSGSQVDTELADPHVASAAAAVFGARRDIAIRFADQLADAGVVRGLLGPREVPRLWTRHLLNCAALSAYLPVNARVVDVGSGAGLPGLVLAIARADLQVDLVEPMLRRTTFLQETIGLLGLTGRVRVHRGRAEEAQIRSSVGGAEWVTARAVAPLDRLVTWCLPLLADGGRLLALKGQSAPDEAAALTSQVRVDARAASVGTMPTGDGSFVITVERAVRRRGRGGVERDVRL